MYRGKPMPGRPQLTHRLLVPILPNCAILASTTTTTVGGARLRIELLQQLRVFPAVVGEGRDRLLAGDAAPPLLAQQLEDGAFEAVCAAGAATVKRV